MPETIKLVIDQRAISEYEAVYFTKHPRAKKPPIKHPYQDTINVWTRYSRMQMNNEKQKWKDFIVWLVEQEGLANKQIERCSITQTIYYSTARRHDLDNQTPKFILDGLVESGLLIDDDNQHLHTLILKCGKDKNNPRTELLIETD